MIGRGLGRRTLWRGWQRLLGRNGLPVLRPREAYDRWAPNYGEPASPLHRIEAAVLAEVLPEVQGSRVLDLGCGRGRAGALALERGAGAVVSVDLSPRMLEAAPPERGAGGDRVAADALSLPFRAASFDVVVSALVLGHIASLRAALREMARVLRADGALVVTDFHPYATLRGWQRTFADAASGRTFAIEQHVHLLEDYMAAFGELGLRLEALREPRHEGFPVVLALRARRLGHDASREAFGAQKPFMSRAG
ncbi:MAG: methyltransferase domain-containing protein [Gemmatimonadetes bacterium]|nr:methyltransferase domain-containing protein [Gemmatimonadota bacterium]